MRSLLIVIEILVGTYNITVHENFIVTTSNIDGSNKTDILSVCQMSSQTLYRFKDNEILLVEHLSDSDDDAHDISISSEIKGKAISNIGENC